MCTRRRRACVCVCVCMQDWDRGHQIGVQIAVLVLPLLTIVGAAIRYTPTSNTSACKRWWEDVVNGASGCLSSLHGYCIPLKTTLTVRWKGARSVAMSNSSNKTCTSSQRGSSPEHTLIRNDADLSHLPHSSVSALRGRERVNGGPTKRKGPTPHMAPSQSR